jgi:transcriptional regulator with GAF, ATPase, and Fis domain
MTELTPSHDGDQQPQSLQTAVFELEERLIRQALTEAANKPTAAARLLGLNNHQALLAMLDNRHSKLRDELGIRKRPRRKSIITRPRPPKPETQV